ncbi:hypothetical protein Q7P37_006636 [Cladosporium fusiforme]
MRPLRFLATLLTCFLAFFLLLCFGPLRQNTQDNVEESHIGAYFNWRTPSSLFPPSAIISLTDDNSTFFLARPAAFGPLLPTKSLSGQLWVGSGFGDDRLAKTGAEGELGCSDVPGWEDGEYSHAFTPAKPVANDDDSFASSMKASSKDKRHDLIDSEDESTQDAMLPDQGDGTDDHLHHPLPASDAVKNRGTSAGKMKKPAHADIQSLQEGAEIAGKVVLLSRGGCGFLEKAKWVQRRGGVALIVGDDVRGGQLVTMYARGDVSNITIPALFTSHTTAHLLSSLIPSGGNVDDLSPEEAARLGLALGDRIENAKSAGRKHGNADKAVFTTTKAATKATSTAKAKSADKEDDSPLREVSNTEEEPAKEQNGGFWSFFSSRSVNGKHEDSRRPPSSGNIDWVLQRDFDENEVLGKATTTSTKAWNHAPTKKADRGSSDGFVIGVQDWRDPDLVAEQKEQNLKLAAGTSTSSTSQAASKSTKSAADGRPKGGSITPGSGEYGKPVNQLVGTGKSEKSKSKSEKSKQPAEKDKNNGGSWFSRFFSHSKENGDESDDRISDTTMPLAQLTAPESRPALAKDIHLPQSNHDEETDHDGLWITLTPTSMSSSPFFDTLLVLVVSPLVTLTVVYALLLLRSRIRRRRWRAPKSVVERLPVRTYQTMPSTSTSSTTSSVSSPVSATTPLLPSNAPRPIRPRPRSRTASDVPAGGSSLQSVDQIEEKRAAGLAEWRRRYGGKQRECVVCLEEYVDGVSRVMSLPCGHEFHEACITPWLTTRRRTCPICKNDIVRSLAHSGGSSSSGSPSTSAPPPPPVTQGLFRDEDEDDVQEQAALLTNEDPGAAGPVISRDVEAEEDLERGVDGEGRRR